MAAAATLKGRAKKYAEEAALASASASRADALLCAMRASARLLAAVAAGAALPGLLQASSWSMTSETGGEGDASAGSGAADVSPVASPLQIMSPLLAAVAGAAEPCAPRSPSLAGLVLRTRDCAGSRHHRWWRQRVRRGRRVAGLLLSHVSAARGRVENALSLESGGGGGGAKAAAEGNEAGSGRAAAGGGGGRRRRPPVLSTVLSSVLSVLSVGLLLPPDQLSTWVLAGCHTAAAVLAFFATPVAMTTNALPSSSSTTTTASSALSAIGRVFSSVPAFVLAIIGLVLCGPTGLAASAFAMQVHSAAKGASSDAGGTLGAAALLSAVCMGGGGIGGGGIGGGADDEGGIVGLSSSAIASTGAGVVVGLLLLSASRVPLISRALGGKARREGGEGGEEVVEGGEGGEGGGGVQAGMLRTLAAVALFAAISSSASPPPSSPSPSPPPWQAPPRPEVAPVVPPRFLSR